MNKWLELLVGLILVVGMILVAYYSSGAMTGQAWAVAGKSLNFWNAAWVFLKGGVFWFVIGIGLLFILLGLSDLRG